VEYLGGSVLATKASQSMTVTIGKLHEGWVLRLCRNVFCYSDAVNFNRCSVVNIVLVHCFLIADEELKPASTEFS